MSAATIQWWGRAQSGRKYTPHAWDGESPRALCGADVNGMTYLSRGKPPLEVCQKCLLLMERSDASDAPQEVGIFTVPGKGTSYHLRFGPHDVQVYLTEKRKNVRVWIDGTEWKRP